MDDGSREAPAPLGDWHRMTLAVVARRGHARPSVVVLTGIGGLADEGSGAFVRIDDSRVVPTVVTEIVDGIFPPRPVDRIEDVGRSVVNMEAQDVDRIWVYVRDK